MTAVRGLKLRERLAAPVAETAVAGVVATGYGRRVAIRRALEAAPVREAIEPGVALDDDGDPFPLAPAAAST